MNCSKKIMKTSPKLLLLLFSVISFGSFGQKVNHDLFRVNKTLEPLLVDGIAQESFWQDTSWRALDQKWIGSDYTSEDFKGRYKIRWNPKGIYLLVEITDDILYDQYEDPFTLWWDDDCVEVFVDPDNSGGGHQYNNNAFAYHVSLTGDVIDIAPDEKPRNYKEHVASALTQNGKITTWELLVKLYSDCYVYEVPQKENTLNVNDHIGFALAYCDNDTSKERENFIGSVFVPGEDKNRGWIDAGIFSTLLLVE